MTLSQTRRKRKNRFLPNAAETPCYILAMCMNLWKRRMWIRMMFSQRNGHGVGRAYITSRARLAFTMRGFRFMRPLSLARTTQSCFRITIWTSCQPRLDRQLSVANVERFTIFVIMAYCASFFLLRFIRLFRVHLSLRSARPSVHLLEA